MIVRILGEGQFRVAESALDELNRLDEDLTTAVEADGENGFRSALEQLLERVRALGEPLADDELHPSDAILPAPDASIDEVRDLLQEDGLLPG